MTKILREPSLFVELHLHQGEEEATGWGSDLTTDYVLFNATYTT
jgi:glutamate N-acetyltransferase/amino-acid N-acetyltransferase